MGNGTKISDFTAWGNNALPDSGNVTFTYNGANYKMTLANFQSQLGVTGTLTTLGDATATSILVGSAGSYQVRQITGTSGVSVSVNGDGTIKVAGAVSFGSTGVKLVNDPDATSLAFRSIVAGDDISVTGATGTITIASNPTVRFGMISMTGNSTATTIAATSTPVLIAGTWTEQRVSNFTSTSAGRLTYTGTESKYLDINFRCSFAPSAGSNMDYKFILYVNGSDAGAPDCINSISNGEYVGAMITWNRQFATNDYVEIYVSNETDSNNVVIAEAVLKVG